LKAKTNWVAFKQDFFTVAMVSDAGFASNGSEIAITPCRTIPTHTKRYEREALLRAEPGEGATLAMRMYMGPNHYNTLRRTEIPSSTASSTWAGASSAG
jgi:hypothetical protein